MVSQCRNTGSTKRRAAATATAECWGAKAKGCVGVLVIARDCKVLAVILNEHPAATGGVSSQCADLASSWQV